jgi:hypothetical protein
MQYKTQTYRVIQNEWSTFCEVIVSIIVRKIGVHMNMCSLLNGYQDRAVRVYKYKSVVNGNKGIEIPYC